MVITDNQIHFAFRKGTVSLGFPKNHRGSAGGILLVLATSTWSYTLPSHVDAAEVKSVIEEVVVTASRREETVKEASLAVSVVTEDLMRRMSVDDLSDFSHSVPGLSVVHLGPGRDRVSIRGISVSGGENSVGYYIDETPIPKTLHGAILNTTVDPKLFDTNRVEVLRGPQGTLYGQSSMGGTIRLIPNRPDTNKFFGSASVAVETVDDGSPLYAVDALVNLPIVEDKVGLRGVVYGRNGGGFIDRRYLGSDGQPTPNDDVGAVVRNTVTDANSENTLGLRLIADFNISDKWRISPMVMYEDSTLDGYQDITAGAINPNDNLVQEFPFNTRERILHKWTLLNLTITGDIGPVNVVSSTSSFTRTFAADEEGGSVTQFYLGNGFNGNSGEQGIRDEQDFTQELRFSSSQPAFGRLDWLIGGYYEDKESERWIDWHATGAEAALGPDAAGDNLFTQHGPINFKSIAGFGELTFRIVNSLKLTGGIRYYDIKQDDTTEFAGLFSGGGGIISTASKSTGEQYRFNLSYEMTNGPHIYMQAAQGFRPGFGAANSFPPECDAELAALGIDPNNVPQEVFPDEVWNYELGLKMSAMDNRFQLNGAIYEIDWTDIQQRTRLQSCGFNFTSNVGKATSDGVELEAFFALNEAWEFTGMLNYTDATLDTDNLALSAEKGERIQEVPEWSGALSAQYSFPMVGDFNGYLRADVQYTDKSFADFLQNEKDPDSVLGELTLVNARFAATTDEWEIALYGRNLLNDVERVARVRAGLIDIPGRPRFVMNRPREFGVSIKRSF